MSVNNSSRRDFLVLGAGQLGMEVLRSLAPRATELRQSVSVIVSPKTASASDSRPSDTQKLRVLKDLGVEVIGFDLASDSTVLQSLFKQYTTVVSCTGFVAGSGTQLKITRAAIDAKVQRYIPWQFGVDYDVVGQGSGQPVFDEQYAVRQLLREENHQTQWIIVSTGMFTSFLFEPSFDVVNLEAKTVHGLGSWDTRVTVTTPEDIGKLTTEILLAEPRISNKVVYIAGDTLSYGELAEVVERVTGQKFEKTLWTIDKLRRDLAQAPEDVMARYRAAFALGDGMWWDKSKTFNAERGIETIDVEHYLERLLQS